MRETEEFKFEISAPELRKHFGGRAAYYGKMAYELHENVEKIKELHVMDDKGSFRDPVSAMLGREPSDEERQVFANVAASSQKLGTLDPNDPSPISLDLIIKSATDGHALLSRIQKDYDFLEKHVIEDNHIIGIKQAHALELLGPSTF